jgi:hypothetical protein
MNIRGHTGLTISKQAQIESFVVKIDVLHLKETNICDDSFSTFDILSSTYNIITNNSPTKYGTASLVKTYFIPENILLDSNGHDIIFKIGSVTLANLCPLVLITLGAVHISRDTLWGGGGVSNFITMHTQTRGGGGPTRQRTRKS